MKDKNLAAVLALFGGFFGLHRFYLGQVGLGIVYCFLPGINVMLGVIDAIVLLSMDEATFDEKYNEDRRYSGQQRRRPADRYDRYRQRELDRQRRTRQRTPSRSSSSQRKNRGVKDRGLPTANRKVRNAGGRTPQRRRGNADRDAGIKAFKDYDYEAAIASFEKSLKQDPQDIATHWNIACAFSLTEDADKALYHLDRAVALGFNDFDRIRTHDALAYLRVQPAYMKFQENNFRLAPEIEATENKTEDDLLSQPVPPKEAPPRTNDDLLEQLQRLGQLREKGLLTEAEFTAQKRKLLG